MKVGKDLLLKTCIKYGCFLQKLPSTLRGPELLFAISGVESSFGQDYAPRHEVEYCPLRQAHWNDIGRLMILRPGRYAADREQAALYREWGCMACCSFTPWQIMAGHASAYTPIELLSDFEKGAEAVVGMLNRKLTAGLIADLASVAHVWNGSASSPQYLADLTKYYNAGLPALEGSNVGQV